MPQGDPPFSGDYFVPGNPWEAWSVSVDGADGSTYVNAGLNRELMVPQTEPSVVTEDGKVVHGVGLGAWSMGHWAWGLGPGAWGVAQGIETCVECVWGRG